MSENKPFSRDSYDLPPLGLTLLDGAGAGEAARFMVSSDPWATLAYTRTGLQKYLTVEDPSLRRFGVRGEGGLVGVVAVRHPWLKGPYLELIALREEHRDRGHGSRVMEWFEAEAGRGGTNAWVVVSDFNHRARAFYAARGYLQVGELPDLTANGRNELLLRKRLG